MHLENGAKAGRGRMKDGIEWAVITILSVVFMISLKGCYETDNKLDHEYRMKKIEKGCEKGGGG